MSVWVQRQVESMCTLTENEFPRLLMLMTVQFPVSEVKELRRRLEDIEANFHGGSQMQDASEELSPDERLNRYASKLRKMSYEDAGNIPGRDVVSDLLERCFLWSDIVLQRQGRLEERFKDTYDTLLGIRNQLEKLSLTQAWSLRETDLYGYQRKLDRVDEARVDGNFLDANGQPAELYEQRVGLNKSASFTDPRPELTVFRRCYIYCASLTVLYISC